MKALEVAPTDVIEHADLPVNYVRTTRQLTQRLGQLGIPGRAVGPVLGAQLGQAATSSGHAAVAAIELDLAVNGLPPGLASIGAEMAIARMFKRQQNVAVTFEEKAP